MLKLLFFLINYAKKNLKDEGLKILKMLFRTFSGTFVEILRRDYVSDTAYYKAIMLAKGFK